MALFYLDTSAIVKRYRAEVGTELVDALFNERLPTDQLTSSFLSVLEVTSVVYRLLTAREIREDIAHEILSRFRQDLDEHVRIWPLDDEVAERAIRVVEDYHPRAADAVHLATALAISAATNLRAVFVSADQDLLRASVPGWAPVHRSRPGLGARAT